MYKLAPLTKDCCKIIGKYTTLLFTEVIRNFVAIIYKSNLKKRPSSFTLNAVCITDIRDLNENIVQLSLKYPGQQSSLQTGDTSSHPECKATSLIEILKLSD